MIVGHVVDIMSIKLHPPYSWSISAIMLITSFSMITQYIMQGKSELGWEPATNLSRFLMVCVGIWFIYAASSILSEPNISIRVLVLSILMMFWRTNTLREYWHLSKRHAQKNALAAQEAKRHLHTKGKL